MKSSEVLRGAQSELKRRGWHKGEFAPRPVVGEPEQDVDTLPCCAWGALNAAVTGDPRDWCGVGERALQFLEKAIETLPEVEDSSVPYWNDEVAQSVDEILAGLEKAALLAEKEGD